ncbi:MAG: GerW family sporulation protein [Oscillospiraceae bacterium]|nr:GerW family sporulation protein [Oscillospiraceae bacterium]
MQNENEKSKINQMMSITMEKIREMGDVKTIIGDPIEAGDTTIIPVSKVSYGFASGGSDLPAKQNPKDLFGGGAGAGVTVQPIAFLVVSKDGNVRLMQISDSDDKVSNIIRSVPELIDKISDMVKSRKDGKENKEEDKKEENKAE